MRLAGRQSWIAAAILLAALLATAPLWRQLTRLQLTPPAPPSSASAVITIPAATVTVETAAAVRTQEQPEPAEAEIADPWQAPLLSPITDESLARWSASVQARHTRRSAVAELADVPALTEQNLEQPARVQQPARIQAAKPSAITAESRAERQQRKRRERQHSERQLQLKLPRAETLLPPLDNKLNLEPARNPVSLPKLIDGAPVESRWQWQGRLLTNDDLGRDPIETPRHVLDEIQGAEIGVKLKTK